MKEYGDYYLAHLQILTYKFFNKKYFLLKMKYNSYKINPMIRQQLEYERREQAIKQEITEFMLFIINILRSNKFSDRELAKVVSENVSVMMSNVFDMGFMEGASNREKVEFGKKLVDVILIIYDNDIDISTLSNNPDRILTFIERFDEIVNE